jgi:hypothetical protein
MPAWQLGQLKQSNRRMMKEYIMTSFILTLLRPLNKEKSCSWHVEYAFGKLEMHAKFYYGTSGQDMIPIRFSE